MANYCLNFSTDKEKEAFNTLVKTVASYGLTEGLARVKVASYIEELSERYFTGKNKNKESVETRIIGVIYVLLTFCFCNIMQ